MMTNVNQKHIINNRQKDIIFKISKLKLNDY